MSLDRASPSPHSKVILASASPRRVQILSTLGVEFSQKPSDIDESILPGETPQQYVLRMAQTKAEAVFIHAHSAKTTEVVIGADTTVCVDDLCLGKPRDYEDFFDMMSMLSGREHQVLSAVSFLSGSNHCTRLSTNTVVFESISKKQMQAYWQTGEPADKAGGYAIQGLGAVWVKRLEGCYTSVMGLPIVETSQMLTQFRIPWALNRVG